MPATFVNRIFLKFRWKWWRNELFLHCGDELNGLRPSWMVLTHGNVIFDILEHSAFQKYSICWVFRSYSVQPHFQCKLKSSRVQRRQQIADVRTRLNLRNQPAANLPLSQRLSVDRSTHRRRRCRKQSFTPQPSGSVGCKSAALSTGCTTSCLLCLDLLTVIAYL